MLVSVNEHKSTQIQNLVESLQRRLKLIITAWTFGCYVTVRGTQTFDQVIYKQVWKKLQPHTYCMTGGK